jgi:hypothetical protein
LKSVTATDLALAVTSRANGFSFAILLKAKKSVLEI